MEDLASCGSLFLWKEKKKKEGSSGCVDTISTGASDMGRPGLAG